MRPKSDWPSRSQRAVASARLRFPPIIITAVLLLGAAADLCKPLHDEMVLDAIAGAVGRFAEAVSAEHRRSS